MKRKAIYQVTGKLRPVSAKRREEIEPVIRKVLKNQAIRLRLSELDLTAEEEGYVGGAAVSDIHLVRTD